MLSFLLGTYLEVGVLSHMVILCLKFEKISNNFPKFHIPIRKVWVFKFFDTLSTHLIMCLLDYCHPSGYEMSSHSLVCISLISSDAEQFVMYWLIFVYFWWRNIYTGTLSIFKIRSFVFLLLSLIITQLHPRKHKTPDYVNPGVI